MSTIAVSSLITSIVELLAEAYNGPAEGAPTWFVDNDPNAGIFGVLRGISAAEASQSVDGSGEQGTTIAANVEHLRWSLANANTALRGGEYQTKWSESWKLVNADEAGWHQLREAFRAEFEALCEAIRQQQALPGEYLNGVLALIPHAAYHLGVIRQMLERVRA